MVPLPTEYALLSQMPTTLSSEVGGMEPAARALWVVVDL